MVCVYVVSRALKFDPSDQFCIAGYVSGNVRSSASTASRSDGSTSALNRNDNVCLIMQEPLKDEAEPGAGRELLMAEDRPPPPEPQSSCRDDEDVFVAADV